MTLSDSRNKEVALGRIKRLASSGLPLEPFVRIIFELVNDAVPSSPNKNFMVGGGRADTYIGSTREANEVVLTHQRFFAESSPEVSGSKISFDSRTMHEVFPSRTIWSHEEIARPDFYRTEGFNAVFRPLGFHHSMVAVFQESGGFLGYYPVWRSVDQKPFSRDDADFLRIAAPHIAHGLRAAQLIQDAESPDSTRDDFQSLTAWRAGVILIDANGKLLAIDPDARLLFQQLGVLDGITVDQFAPSPVRDALAYISRALDGIYRGTEADSERAAAPVYRVYQHWSGIVLKFRGVRMIGTDNRDYTTILVERGETPAARRRRTMLRWGLTPREAEILALVGQNKTGPEIAIMSSISHDTVRKHMGRIFEKLGVENRAAAASIALDAALTPRS